MPSTGKTQLAAAAAATAAAVYLLHVSAAAAAEAVQCLLNVFTADAATECLLPVSASAAAAVAVRLLNVFAAADADAAAGCLLPVSAAAAAVSSTAAFCIRRRRRAHCRSRHRMSATWSGHNGSCCCLRQTPSPCQRSTATRAPLTRPLPTSLSNPDSFFAFWWISGGADPPWLPRSTEAHQPGPLPPGELQQRYGCGCGQPAGSCLGIQIHARGPLMGTPLVHISNLPPSSLPSHTSPATLREAKHTMLSQGPPYLGRGRLSPGDPEPD